MYLKKLEMQGFKSFVDKTVLEFDKGITAIVGPNGSGKSNISDAVKWVLGEQSPTTLRGSKMEDIIFAGTQSRKPVGMAEVSLIMDNEDHALNIDFLEVRITRRLYRSGESEYLINGAQCRLKDILMLFADTGIGKDGYSIIGQGRIDEILKNKSEDRRSIFEDASGIMKYRMRKIESERKLAQTEQNLLRIDDIVRELEIQLKPLEKQSEVAKKYLALKYELRDIEVGVLSETIAVSEKLLEEVNANAKIAGDQKAEREERLVAIQNENSEKTELSRKLLEQIDKAKQDKFEHEKRVEHLKNEMAINSEKIVSAGTNTQRAESDKAELAGRISVFQEDIKRFKAKISGIDKEIAAINTKGTEGADALNEVNKKLDAASAEMEKIRGEIVDFKLKAAECLSQIESINSQIALMTGRKNDLDTELKNLNDAEDAQKGELEQAEQDAKAKNEEAYDAKQTYRNNTEKLAVLRAKIEGVSKEISTALGDIQSKQAQMRLLKEMEADYEGYARSVKEVLQMCQKNPDFGHGVYGAVAQLITVSGEYELAIETALGQSYQNIITESESETKSAIEFLKQHRYGRATFMPLTAANGRRLEDGIQRDLESNRGYLGLASDKVSCDKKFKVIADSLLGRVAVFKDLDSAIEAAKDNHYGFMCVSLEGDLLRTSGAITGGAQERGAKTVGALSRTREIPKLEKDIKALEEKSVKLVEDMEAMKKEASELDATQAEQFEAMKELETAAMQLESKCAALRERKQGRVARRAQLVEELKGQITFVQGSRTKIDEYNKENERVTGEIASAEARLEDATKVWEAIKTERDDANTKLFDLKLGERELLGRKESVLGDIKRLEGEIETAREKVKFYDSQIADSSESAKSLNEENEVLSKQVAVSKLDAENSEKKIAELTELKNATDESLGGIFTEINDINQTITRLGEEISRLEIKRVHAENEINAGKNRLWDEYELTLTQAAELAKPVEDYPEANRRISELKGEIKALGPVNVNAVEEYESTLKRYEFMSTQSKDMTDSKDKLEKVISELTAVMRTQFMEQFEIIRRNFSEVFVELFGGGKADIVLADDNPDVLECGIDINVQPPGKKLQNMMLLSGGERALTAIALLFGILRMRPSPFCLLDEIEAALDEANVYRLSDYLENVSGKTQFIMVTHRKGTMEHAESLYGVTMEEKGISKVVSLKMD